MTDNDKYLDRDKASRFLDGLGLRISAATLQTYASRGGGPLYARFGKRAVYLEKDLLEWAAERVKAPGRTHTERRTKMEAA
jgi:hypothetical protein